MRLAGIGCKTVAQVVSHLSTTCATLDLTSEIGQGRKPSPHYRGALIAVRPEYNYLAATIWLFGQTKDVQSTPLLQQSSNVVTHKRSLANQTMHTCQKR